MTIPLGAVGVGPNLAQVQLNEISFWDDWSNSSPQPWAGPDLFKDIQAQMLI